MEGSPGVPLYPGVYQVQHRPGADGVVPTMSTTFVTTDRPEDVVRFYRDAMQSSGWSYVPLCGLYAHRSKSYTAYVQAQPAKDGRTAVDVKVVRGRGSCVLAVP